MYIENVLESVNFYMDFIGFYRTSLLIGSCNVSEC